jgi:hypothetical protein
MSTSKRFGWMVLAILAAFAVAAQPAAAGKKQKPDFALKSVTFAGPAPHYVLLDRADTGLPVTLKVKNQGKKTSEGKVNLSVLTTSGSDRGTVFAFEIPKLKPGRTHTVEFTIKGSELDGINYYTTEACASAKKDPKEGNDCRDGPALSAIPRTWTGTTNATWSDGLVTQSLVSNDVTFTFASAESAVGTFLYLPTGSLTATVTGDDDPDCSFSGTGDTAIQGPRANLTFSSDLSAYRAVGEIPSSVTYTAYAACFGGSPGPYQQQFGSWLETPIVVRNADEEVLMGTQTTSGPDSWSWNLRAE